MQAEHILRSPKRTRTV